MKQKTPVIEEGSALRQRIIDAAGKIFVNEGHENLSMRRVAQAAGCSQMAAYRYFANKEALTQHLCSQLYTEFTTRMFQQMNVTDDPAQQLNIFIAALLKFAVTYPDHYSLIFLVRHSDPEVIAEREQLGEHFLKKIHELIRRLLPPTTPTSVSNARLRQVLTCLHGTAALLIAHPKAYGLTKQRAVKDAEEAIALILR